MLNRKCAQSWSNHIRKLLFVSTVFIHGFCTISWSNTSQDFLYDDLNILNVGEQETTFEAFVVSLLAVFKLKLHVEVQVDSSSSLQISILTSHL